jgi:ubiquinone/menaquinone biosynthesis C-methylase UbiE
MEAKAGPSDHQRRIQLIRELVRKSYEQSFVVARYTTVGLWPAEEILALEHIPDEARVLDLGCGAGRCAIALAELGLEVVGVDLSRTMIEAARLQAEMAGVEVGFQVMDAMDLELPADSFDVVLCAYNGLELLPGIQGKEKALAEVWRVLKPGGLHLLLPLPLCPQLFCPLPPAGLPAPLSGPPGLAGAGAGAGGALHRRRVGGGQVPANPAPIDLEEALAGGGVRTGVF